MPRDEDDERTPLLQFPGSGETNDSVGEYYHQFCYLVGIEAIDTPSSGSGKKPRFKPQKDALYSRVVGHLGRQTAVYYLTATLTNTLLMSQVVLGAALTGLGASQSSHILITVFGALNTVIAGLIAFLKSRGQPMRARNFRDDLERIVDGIENSAIMWLGISRGAHGYDAIDIDDMVTVRSEVARLTRLYDDAVIRNSNNDPDNYALGPSGDPHSTGLRTRPGQPQPGAPAPVASAAAVPANSATPLITNIDPDDRAPATAPVEPPKPKDTDASKNVDPKGSGGDQAADSKGKDPAEASSSSDLLVQEGRGPSDPAAKDQPDAATGPAKKDDPNAEPEKHSEDTSK